MSEQIKDGGPAFGSEVDSDKVDMYGHPIRLWKPGMTLRDLFAGQALAGMLANESWFEHIVKEDRSKAVGAIVNSAYGFSDAMLAERERKQE